MGERPRLRGVAASIGLFLAAAVLFAGHPRLNGSPVAYARDLPQVRAVGRTLAAIAAEGVELGSHGVRHVRSRQVGPLRKGVPPMARWTAEDWLRELDEPQRILDLFDAYDLPTPANFRAPCLETSDALFDALEASGALEGALSLPRRWPGAAAARALLLASKHRGRIGVSDGSEGAAMTTTSGTRRASAADRPVRILGAGLSGLAAAINLALAGRRVEVFEKRSEVGQRFRGDLQGLRNWMGRGDYMDVLRRMNLPTDFPHRPISDVVMTNGRKVAPVSFGGTVHRLVERGVGPGSLDQTLKRRALALGVHLRLGETRPEHRVDIVACGPRTKEPFAVAKGITFETSTPDCAWGLVDEGAAPGGYAYLLTWGGRGCLVTVLFRDFQRANEAFERTSDIFARLVDPEIRAPRSMGGFGRFSEEPELERDGVLRVGEAAGLQDMAWGFGMDLALDSGYLAARCMLEGRDYARIGRRRFRGRVRASLVNRFLWDTFYMDRGFGPAVGAMRRSRLPMAILRHTHRYTLLHRAVYPLAKARLRQR